MSSIANPPVSPAFLPERTIVIVGMPGAGKSSVGRKLAARLALPFFDADDEIETAAGMTIEQIFERFGETEFRKGERRVIARLLEGPRHVLATGGGAFINHETRELIRARGISVWLRTDLSILAERTGRRNDRPLLKGDDPRAILEDMLAQREPVYAEADVTVQSDGRPAEETVERVMQALAGFETSPAETGSQPREKSGRP